MPRPIIVSENHYAQCPVGLCDARLQQVEDLGTQDHGYGQKNYLLLRFETSHTDPQTGEPLTVERLVTKSLNSQSALRPICAAFLNGAPIPPRLDLNNLLGLPCRLVIVHKTGKDGRAWARIESVLPPLVPVSTASPSFAPSVPSSATPTATRAPF